MGVYPFGGIYDRFGYTRRNELMEALPVNPLPPNAMQVGTGNAGQDGFTTLSRANRITGERHISKATPEFEGPKIEDY